MKTQLATAGLLLGALLLPVAGYSADKAPSASPASPKETAGPDTAKDRPAAKSGRRSAQPIDDSVITTKVKARFVKDKQVSALNIEVKTVNGVVELSGAAKSKQEAAKAVALARKVKGVKSVKNDIQVAGSTAAGTMADKDRPATTPAMSDKDRPAKMGRSDQPVDDTVITTKVKGLYVKDKQVSAMNVEVKTVNGVVELSGTAKSKQEADQAVSLARGVQGVKSVKNDIQVK